MQHELQPFLAPAVSLRFETDEAGNLIARRKTLPTFQNPVSTVKEIMLSHAMIQDCKIRSCIEQALLKSECEIQETTKFLESMGADDTVEVLTTIGLEYPNQMPSAENHGTNNDVLRSFAFDAFDALATHFGNNPWSNWYIVPYFRHGDDTQEIFHLGVFVDHFNKTVLE